MIEFTGIIYLLYLITLGRFVQLTLTIENNSDEAKHFSITQVTYGLFIGIFVHMVLFNFLQFFSLSHLSIKLIMSVVCIICLFKILWFYYHHPQNRKKFEFENHSIVTSIMVLIGSLFIYYNSRFLLNIAWDSWTVWEGRAEQWRHFSLSSTLKDWPEWLYSQDALYNPSAHYPDGLSLLYFFPKLFDVDSFQVIKVITLVSYALVILSAARNMAQNGAPKYLGYFFIVIMYTTPLINNHLMLQGYADIWIGMYLLLAFILINDLNDSQNTYRKLTLLIFVIALPLLKLEGWVWAGLLISSYFLIRHTSFKSKLILLIIAIMFALFIWINGGIHLSFDFGNFIIDSKRLEIFKLIQTSFELVNITPALLEGFVLQNNWSILWFCLPMLFIFTFSKQRDQANQITVLFFITAMVFILFLFFFTQASSWALDSTAMNRVILQLTPGYVFLLFKAMIVLTNKPKPLS